MPLFAIATRFALLLATVRSRKIPSPALPGKGRAGRGILRPRDRAKLRFRLNTTRRYLFVATQLLAKCFDVSAQCLYLSAHLNDGFEYFKGEVKLIQHFAMICGLGKDGFEGNRFYTVCGRSVGMCLIRGEKEMMETKGEVAWNPF